MYRSTRLYCTHWTADSNSGLSNGHSGKKERHRILLRCRFTYKNLSVGKSHLSEEREVHVTSRYSPKVSLHLHDVKHRLFATLEIINSDDAFFHIAFLIKSDIANQTWVVRSWHLR